MQFALHPGIRILTPVLQNGAVVASRQNGVYRPLGRTWLEVCRMEGGPVPQAGGRGSRRGRPWVVLIAVLSLATVVAGCSCEEAVTVPNLVGLEEIEARHALSDAGLELGDVERLTVEADAPEVGTVLSQVPSAGSEVDSGSEVSLVVAEGPEETTDGDEGEAPPPAASGGSGSAGGSGVQPSTPTKSAPDPVIDEEAWRIVVSDSGKAGGWKTSVFTTSADSAAVQLVGTVASPSGGEFRITLADANAVGEGSVLVIAVRGTPTATDHATEAASRPQGQYEVFVEAPNDGSWSYEVWEKLH